MSRVARGSRNGKGHALGLALATATLLLSLGACSAQSGPATRPGRGFEIMVASWYGEKYHGRQTASGEIYDMYALTAAHKTLPFGTRLRVTHPRTRRTVVVEITDRGPFVRGRDLDLSYGAAEALGMVREGVARVRAQRLSD